jgi:hypothetical protein
VFARQVALPRPVETGGGQRVPSGHLVATSLVLGIALASLRTTIGADDTSTATGESTAIGEAPGRRRSRRGLVLLLPALFALAAAGSWYVLGR